MVSAKEWNATFRKTRSLSTKDKEYQENKKTVELSKNPFAAIITSTLPRRISERIGLLEEDYKIQGSIGQGLISEIPWICIFDKEITTSARHGYYLVYAFKADMSGVYLCLNQGWTQYQNTFGVKDGLVDIRKNALLARRMLRSDQGFSYTPINLKATKNLGRGYQAGSICSIYYSAKDFPSDEVLLSDLRNLLGVYRELKGLVGSEIIEIHGSVDEETFQEEIQRGKIKELAKGAIARKEKKQTSSSFLWPRDPNISYTALEKAAFKCENKPLHTTFVSAKTGHPFMEAHHLIPMEYQKDFKVSIDVPENIICLCPNCHRAFHNSTWDHMTNLISMFYKQREVGLKERGINIPLEKVIRYYSTATTT